MDNLDHANVLSESELSEVSGGSKIVTCVQYKVKSGDTLNSIAKKYGTTVNAIMEVNLGKITNKNHIEAGWTINVPVK